MSNDSDLPKKKDSNLVVPENQPIETTIPDKSGGHGTVVLRASETYIAPLPRPKDLAGYERILTGAAERLFNLLEQEQVHRHKQENIGLNAAIADTKRGQNYGLIIALAGLLGGILAILLGHDIAGSVFSGLGLSGLVGLFVREHFRKGSNHITEESNELTSGEPLK